MARFSDEQIERIKQDISLARLVEAKGVGLKKHGKDLIGHCPFHDDKTPSFVVSPEKNLWNCLGACGEGGTVIDWVMKSEGVSFRHAVELLRDDISVLAASEGVTKKNTVPKLASPVQDNADDQLALQQVTDFYYQTLKQESEAQDYLRKRGLDSAELIDQFKLGFANRTLGLRLPHKNRAAGKAIREQLQRVGIYRDTGHEHFSGSLVIPVMDGKGNITEVYGRKLLDRLRKGTPKHTYLPGPHRGVFNPEGFCNTEEIILCEALIDALTFWRWGFKHVTSSFGINGFTDEILQAFINNKIQRVLIAYDRDDAGNTAADKVAALLNKNGIDTFRVLFPKGMDANSYACQVSPPQKSLGLVIRKAQWMGKGKAPEITSAPLFLAAESDDELQGDVEAIENTSTSKESVEPELKQQENNPVDAVSTPAPAVPVSDLDAVVKDNDIHITLGDRVYRIRGLDKNTSCEQLKINLMVSKDDLVHVDKLDLYSHKLRQVFINQASLELGLKEDVIKKDLGKLLLKLEALQEESQQADESAKQKTIELSDDEHKAALSLLKDSDLLSRIVNDFRRIGVVGEDVNTLVSYLACVSRKLDKPLAVMIQSSSAAGKSSVMDAVLSLMPEEERVQYSAMTGQSLFYMGETSLKNKILAISEEEGAHNASYALKLLQSEGKVSIASTGKDDNTGDLITKEYTVEGPVSLFFTTTAIDIDEELKNRCVVLDVNESREQTAAIHDQQRFEETLEGLLAGVEKDSVVALHQNAQRLIKPLRVVNPYANQLTFLSDKTRTRRDHKKYLLLIRSIALLHQYQREIKTAQKDGKIIEYVEVTLADIEMANSLAHDVLGRTLDELPPQTRKLLQQIQVLVRDECKAQKIEQSQFRFSRKQVREFTGWGNTQLKLHIKRLEDMEFLLVHRGGRGQSFEYELLYDTDSDKEKHLIGLIDTEQLKKYNYDTKKSGQNDNKSGSSRPQVGGKSAPVKTLNANSSEGFSECGSETEKCASIAVYENPSYLQHRTQNTRCAHGAGSNDNHDLFSDLSVAKN